MRVGFYFHNEEEQKEKKTKLMPGDKVVIDEKSRSILLIRKGKIIPWVKKMPGEHTYQSEFSIKNFQGIVDLISKVAGIGGTKEPLYKVGRIEIELCLEE